MRSVKNHGSKFPHDRERTHVDDEIVVSETRASLGDEDFVISRRMALLDHVLHVPRRHELALLDVHHAFAHGRGYHQIRLPAKKRGNLQYIDFGNLWHIVLFMHLRETRHLHVVFHFLQNAYTLSESRYALSA